LVNRLRLRNRIRGVEVIEGSVKPIDKVAAPKS
jgi:hypothetical protein